jgi:lipopolysaccharide export LptBFGC system permease protein LptF
MTTEEPARTPDACERVRRGRLSLDVRLPGLVILGLALLFVGGRRISQGEDVAMWVAIVSVYAVAAGIAVWLMRRGVDDARE